MVTKNAKDYTHSLQQERWQRHCNSFNKLSGVRRLWSTFPGMLGKTKARNTADALLLQLECREEDPAQQFSLITFSQPQAAVVQSERKIKMHEIVSDLQAEDEPFTESELLAAMNIPRKIRLLASTG